MLNKAGWPLKPDARHPMTDTPIKSKVADYLATTLSADRLTILQDMELCPATQKEQFAFKAFRLAKQLGQNPKEAAASIADKLRDSGLVEDVNAIGPYINFSLKPALAAPSLLEKIDGDGRLHRPTPANRQVFMVEHSQPNTHKELHIGHTRNSVLGDTLCRLLNHAGHDVHAENYHGDEGAHVAKCIWYMCRENLRPAPDDNRGTWLGKIYVLSNDALESADADTQTRIKGEISEVLKQIEARNGPYYEVWKETRQWSLDLFHQMYRWLDIRFDSDRCESDVSDESFRVVDEYFKKGLFIKSEGAIGADLSAFDLGFCMLLKSDGRGLYATKDIALALARFRDYHPDTCIYVVDNRQSHHFRQVFATLKVMGFREADKCYHLAYEMVETKDGAMSSRKGNIVPLLELIDRIGDRAFSILKERYHGEWSDQEIEDISRKISVAAIRYGMIRVDPDSKIVFDMDGWLTLEGNTGPYLQYVYARLQSLLRKADADEIASNNRPWEKLTSLSEQKLLAQLSLFEESVQTACEKQKPNIFAAYVYDLARAFNAFYAEVPIVHEQDKPIRAARLGLIKLTSAYLGQGLDLLGIPRIDRM